MVDCEHKTAPYVESSEYFVVRTNNVKSGVLDYTDIKCTSFEGFEEWTKRAVPKFGQILFTREAPAGESCLVPKGKKVCLGQRMVLLIPNDAHSDGVFLSYVLQSRTGTFEIQKYVIGTTVTRINIADIKKIVVTGPSLPEQQKIAGFLSAVDEKLKHLNRKKELLQQYKKGAMQKLFSQELRFKREDGSDYEDWEEKRFGDIAVRSSERVDPSRSSESHRCIELEHIEQNTGKLLGYVPSINQKSIKTVFKSGEVLYGKLRPNLKKFHFAQFEGVCSSEIWVLRESNGQNLFLFYLIQSEAFQQIAMMVSGSKMPRLEWPSISSAIFNIPTCLEEQQKIAAFLSSLDRKIDAVSAQIELTQQFKKGLLQEMFV